MKRKPTCKTYLDGIKYWYLNGKRHREDGPAYEGADGWKEWWLSGKYHREDGPAVYIEEDDGYEAWYLNGKEYTEQQYWQELYRRGKITEDQLVIELI